MLVLGDREQEAGEVSVRSHEQGDLGSMSLERFGKRLREEIGSVQA
jgi:threonyl-tRNA synthetase